jgi:uncharacterized membrane protein
MTEHSNSRLEAFCDAVFAIALTLLIIDIRIPAATAIHTTADLWVALRHLLPSIFAFVLSFGIIFINWVNHHEFMRLIDKSSHPFIYANGFLMMGIVFFPFPTALLGDNLMTSHAAPAVVLYSLAGVIVGLGWALVSWTALKPRPLTRNEHGASRVRDGLRNGRYAMAFYLVCAIVAVWLPIPIAVVLTIMWLYWVIYGTRVRSRTE